ncbi:MAG TPA: hypothetical protein ENK28_08165 [Aliiroseovarius sp.]|nr:hypothetical protein [Aliiroseovarius sp.]
MATQKTTRHPVRRLLFLLWVTILAYGLPEVIAGTGRLWIVTPGVYLFAAPLYFLHFMVLVQIALRTGRTSWPALYLFGVIFGLYETWITKVVWAGYADSDGFSFGAFGPWFGIHETLGLVLFYHAVISFLLPLAAMSRLFPAWGQAFPVPDWVFGTGRMAFLRRLGLVVILGVVTAANNPVLPEYLITWLPLLALLWLGYLWLRRQGAMRPVCEQTRPFTAPRFSLLGFLVIIVLLGLVYGGAIPKLRPDATPPAPALMLTALFYPVLALAIWRTRARDPNDSQHQATQPAKRPFGWLLAVFLLGLALLVLAGAGVNLFAVLAPFAFIIMMPLGAILFLWLGLWRAVVKRG